MHNPFPDLLINAGELESQLGSPGLRLVDASWYLPAQKRDGRGEYEAERIPGAVYFDIDAVADKSTGLPHMLPSPEAFASAVGAMGIAETDDIVVYDGPGIFSSARAWWTFRVMGAKNVRILAGGFDRWKAAGRPVETGAPQPPAPAIFRAAIDAARVASIDDIRAAIDTGRTQILDARPFGRFCGIEPEPRAGLRSGHMPGAQSLSWDRLVRDGSLRPAGELAEILRELAVSSSRRAITSCGSGVTAAIVSLALTACGHDNHALYDGSWAEWGAAENAPVAQWLNGRPPEK